MNNDYSWLGLYKRGIKLQWRIKKGLWFDVTCEKDINILTDANMCIRYKHSIQ